MISSPKRNPTDSDRPAGPLTGATPTRFGALFIVLSVLAAMLIATPAAQAAAGNNRLVGGEQLRAGQQLVSSDGRISATLSTDGNFAVRGSDGTLFSSGTAGTPGARVVMQTDGNLVLYDAAGKARWSTGTWGHPGSTALLRSGGTLLIEQPDGRTLWSSGAAVLQAGQSLTPGSSMYAAGGQLRLSMQTDGNLVVYRDRTVLWYSHTWGSTGAYALMQTDGNLVVYLGRKALWHSHTWANPGAVAALQPDGYLVVYSSIGTPLWWKDAGSGPALCASTAKDPAGTTITRWNPVTLCVLAALRRPAAELEDVNLIIQYESGGDPTAINLWDLNWKAGHPSKGLIQVIQPTFDYYRSNQLPNDLYNPAANLYAGLNYAVHNYGSIHDVPGLVSLRNGGGYKGYVAK